jgi:cyclic pyranopterin phosphate synthase
MPEEDYVWLPREELLSFEELVQLVDIFTGLGVTRLRLTGGEPLLRQHLDRLVGMLAHNSRIRDLALTTNGVLFADYAEALKRAGLGRVTISLDTLRRDRFREMTRRDEHDRVLSAFDAARSVGFTGTKLDAVIVRGENDDELADLIEFGRSYDTEVRFIEYMDVLGATKWTLPKVVTRDEMLQRLEGRYGKIIALPETSAAPASRFRLPDGTVFGIIASTSSPFCRTCDRSRITADGMWYRCLYATDGTDLRRLLRSDLMKAGASREAAISEISEAIAAAWRGREDRGAEVRLARHHREAFVGIEELRRDPHLEMHTRGG